MTPDKNLPLDVAIAIRFDAANDEALLPINVVAAATGISISKLAQMRCKTPKLLPYSKKGKFVWYRKKDVLKYMKSETY